MKSITFSFISILSSLVEFALKSTGILRSQFSSMANPSSLPSASLELLLDEIEATPREYWTDLLDTLRQFRQNIPLANLPIVNVEQARKNQAAIDLLDSWLDDDEDAAEHQQTWDFLKTALDEDRLSDRRLFL
jgi:hypothetical protein